MNSCARCPAVGSASAGGSVRLQGRATVGRRWCLIRHFRKHNQSFRKHNENIGLIACKLSFVDQFGVTHSTASFNYTTSNMHRNILC